MNVSNMMCLGVLIVLIGLAGCDTTPDATLTGPFVNQISMTPTQAQAGSGDLQVTITGTGFDGAGIIQTRVVWSANGESTFLARTVVSSTRLKAVIPAALLAHPVTAQVFVEKFDQIEGTVSARSNAVSFNVTGRE